MFCLYPELYALIGSTVPNYKGLFLRGYGSQTHSQNNGSTIGVTATTHASGALGAIQGDAMRAIRGKIGKDGNETERHPYAGVLFDPSGAFGEATSFSPGYERRSLFKVEKRAASEDAYDEFNFDSDRVIPTANENRPANIAVRYLIRASD